LREINEELPAGKVNLISNQFRQRRSSRQLAQKV
jgi:hypothetical protein